MLPVSALSQYVFEGQVDPSDWNGQAYLSEIKDYRKLNGVFNEQLIQRVPLDSLGIFRFSGNSLSEANKLYRIHVDRCASYEQDLNHFTGNCEHSKAMIIIANNKDSISLPQRFDNEIFCFKKRKDTCAADYLVSLEMMTFPMCPPRVDSSKGFLFAH